MEFEELALTGGDKIRKIAANVFRTFDYYEPSLIRYFGGNGYDQKISREGH
nr:hypothetical protein [uncultured Anaerostipes sp.]